MGFRDIEVCKEDELVDGQLKGFEVDGQKILIGRMNGKYYAASGSCPHYGAPLDKGVLSDGRVVCPWHHAVFNITNGDLLEPPSRDHLHNYETSITDGRVFVKVPEKIFPSRPPRAGKYDKASDSRTFVIVGAGASGHSAAQTLREGGFKGRLIMITHESKLPYDRPNLSKEYLMGEAKPEWMPLREEDYYKNNSIELWRNKLVTKVAVQTKQIEFDDGDSLRCDSLLLAMGGIPLTLDVPGSDLENVVTLRYYSDADRIIDKLDNIEQVAVIGAGFIGMESAYSLRKRDVPVTVIAPEQVPFENIVGLEIGEMIKKAHERIGTEFRLGASAKEFKGDGKVSEVVLDNGASVKDDLVIVGIGVRPATDIVEGVKLDPSGAVEVDDHFQLVPGVYATGDIASFPFWQSNQRIRIEHWRTAEQMGHTAASNMLGKDVPYRSMPFFWTAQAGMQLRYIGYCRDWDEIIIDGNLAPGQTAKISFKGTAAFAETDHIAFYDGSAWNSCPCTLSSDKMTIHAEVSHFSAWTVLLDIW
jgi:NADPH-dependent 2,4-dienoyl-CoA reductase/sulfur reductase-like enzyme/nitrite reductase/ring-hydroxylating ferredoxin subunit